VLRLVWQLLDVRLHPLRLGQCVAQLEERDVRVLGNQLLKECTVWCQLALTAWTPPRGRGRIPSGSDLSCPSCARGWREFQT